MITLYILTLIIKAAGLCVEACFIIAGQILDFALSFITSFVKCFIEAAILEYMHCKGVKVWAYELDNVSRLLTYDEYKRTF